MEILSCVFVIIGIIIGAGFASGKEIYTFFFIYGFKGIVGILISSVIIGYIIYKSFKIIKKYNINSYEELLNKIIPNDKLQFILNSIINLFLLITFFIMCAGFSAYFKQEFGIKEVYSSIVIAIISYVILNKDIKGIFFLNSILIPIIIMILGILGIKSVSGIREFDTVVEGKYIWIIKAILYASYNCITLISMLVPMKKYIKTEKDVIKISILTTIIIIFLAIIIVLLLLNINSNIGNIELPTVYVSGLLGKEYKYLYGIIILGAITTTAISAGYGFLKNITTNNYRINNMIICLISIFVSLFGFSNLVNNIYPIFGILGIIQLILILKYK